MVKSVKKRIVKKHSVRRTEIITVAQKRFYADGYEGTSIKDLIDELGIAKGTFYHYFRSKQELLDAIVDRTLAQTLRSIEPTVEDAALSPLEKFERLFAGLEAWKMENEAFLDFLRVWYRDENAMLRQMSRRALIKHLAPVLARIIQQGIGEGVFVAENPADIAEIVLVVGQSLTGTVEEALLRHKRGEDTLDLIERKTATTERAIERLLGAPEGSIEMFDSDSVKQWLN